MDKKSENTKLGRNGTDVSSRQPIENKRVVLKVNEEEIHLILGKSVDEWVQQYGQHRDEVWSVPLEELLDGTLAINEDIWYWYIDGRCFETDEEVY